MLRAFRTTLEFIAAFLGVVLLMLAFLIWRLNDSPVNSTFLTPYIERGIEKLVPDADVQIAHTLLSWDNADHSIALHTDGLVIKDGQGSTIATMPNLDIRLSLVGLAVGQFWPTEMTINHPEIKLVRRTDGQLYFADMAASPRKSSNSGDTRVAIKNAMDNLTHAYAMRHLTVYRAIVDVHDEASNSDWSIDIAEISLQHNFTQLVGLAKIDVKQKDVASSLELHYTYDYEHKLHRVSTRFQGITPAQLVGGHPETLGLGAAKMFDLPLSGETEVAFDTDLNLADAAATLHGGKGALHVPEIWDKPRPITSFDFEGDFDRKAQRLNIVTAALDVEGAKLSLTANGHGSANPLKDLDFAVDLQLKDWPMEALGGLWPNAVVANAREWMMQNITRGTYDKGTAKFSGSLSWNDLGNISLTSGAGKVSASHGWVSYIPGMPALQDVDADADFDLKQMNIHILSGGIGKLKLQPFTATISGLDAEDQYIDLPLKITGPIPEVLALIDHPPLGYARAVSLPTDAITGQAAGEVDFHFELLKELSTNDVDVKGAAHLSNLASSQLIKGVDITQGDLDLTLDKSGFAIKGPLLLNKAGFQIAWQQNFREAAGKNLREVTLNGTIKDDQWKNLGLDALAGTRGAAAVALHVVQPTKAKSMLNGNLDFANADLHVNQFNWNKKAGTPAILQFKAEMAEGKDIQISSVEFRSPEANAQGRGVLSAAGTLKSVTFDPLVIGRTNATLAFTQTEGDQATISFNATGKSLDISGLKGGKDPGRADPRPKDYHLKVDRLYTSDTGVITNAEGFMIRDGEGWSAISLHGLADGEHPLSIELTAQADGQRTFIATCDDFGKLLKGLGMTDTVKGGEVKIVGSSASDNPRAIVGTIRIGSFTVNDLPALVLLLNATSPFGFVGIVTDSASFDHLKGKFRWQGDQEEFRHVNVAGDAVGLNIDGQVDLNSGNANLYGTIVPFSMVNKMLSYIPVLGDILTGGNDGGVLAVAYRIKGPLADPRISVNPVSLLTPGFLRNLFFGGDDGEGTEPEKLETPEPVPDFPLPESSAAGTSHLP